MKKHVGRPTNEEVKRRKIKKAITVALPVTAIAVAAIAVVSSGSLSKLMGNSVTEYYCADSSYTLEGTNCKKTIKKSANFVGDADLNGSVDIQDVTEIQFIMADNDLAKTRKPADVNLDGTVNEIDLRLLQNYLSGGSTTSTVSSGSEYIGVKKVCESDEYTLNGDYCEKIDVVKALQKQVNRNKNLVDVTIKDDQNGNTEVKDKVNLSVDFKLNDTSKKYYYLIKKYDDLNNEIPSSRSNCLEVKNGVANHTLDVNTKNETKATITIYEDSICKAIASRSDVYRFETKKYTVAKVEEPKEKVTVTVLEKEDYTNLFEKGKPVSLTLNFKLNDKSQDYYYLWQIYTGDNLDYTSECYKAQNFDRNVGFKVFTNRKGKVTVYSDSACKNEVSATETKTYTYKKPVEVTLTPENNKTTLIKNTVYKIKIDFKINDTTKKYYYTWGHYANGKNDFTSGCREVTTKSAEDTLRMNATRYGEVKVYSDSSCKNQVSVSKTKTYTYQDPVEITITPENSKTSLSKNTVYEITTSFKINDNTKQYYYTWEHYADGKKDFKSGCRKVTTKKAVDTLRINAERYGEIKVYSDSSCKNQIAKKTTKKYTCSNCNTSSSNSNWISSSISSTTSKNNTTSNNKNECSNYVISYTCDSGWTKVGDGPTAYCQKQSGYKYTCPSGYTKVGDGPTAYCQIKTAGTCHSNNQGVSYYCNKNNKKYKDESSCNSKCYTFETKKITRATNYATKSTNKIKKCL